MNRLLQRLVSAFFLLNIVRRFKSRSSLIRINAAQFYVLGVKKTRLFFLGALFMLVSLVVLFNGIFLIQTAFFTYSMWSNEKKFIVALILGGIEFLGAAGIMIYLFREETWGRFSEVNKVVSSVIDK